MTETAPVTICDRNCDGSCSFVTEEEVHRLQVQIVTENSNIVIDNPVTIQICVSDCDESVTIRHKVVQIVTDCDGSAAGFFFGFFS